VRGGSERVPLPATIKSRMASAKEVLRRIVMLVGLMCPIVSGTGNPGLSVNGC